MKGFNRIGGLGLALLGLGVLPAPHRRENDIVEYERLMADLQAAGIDAAAVLEISRHRFDSFASVARTILDMHRALLASGETVIDARELWQRSKELAATAMATEQILLARRDPNAFIEYVTVTGKRSGQRAPVITPAEADERTRRKAAKANRPPAADRRARKKTRGR